MGRGEYKHWVEHQERNQCREHTCIQQILDHESEIETVRTIVFENNSHIIADVEIANPDYFTDPKYKTPEDVLRKKKKTCMSNFCCTIERFYKKGA